jgi:hypothetical protein
VVREGEGVGGEWKTAALGQGRGEGAEEEGGLQGAHGGSGGGRLAPTRWERRDLERNSGSHHVRVGATTDYLLLIGRLINNVFQK